MTVKAPKYMIGIPSNPKKVVVKGVPTSAVKEKVELIQRQLAKDETELANRRERMLTKELAKLPEPPTLFVELSNLTQEDGRVSKIVLVMEEEEKRLALEEEKLEVLLRALKTDLRELRSALETTRTDAREAYMKRVMKEDEIETNEKKHQAAVDKVNNRYEADTEGVRGRIFNHKRNLAALKVRHPEAFEEDNRQQTTEESGQQGTEAATTE